MSLYSLAHFPCLVRSPTKMLAVRETAFSVVASAFANNLTIKALAVITVFVVIPLTVHYASPTRLTDILVNIMSRVNALCAEALEAGHLSSSEMEKLRNLQRKVSAINLETLQNSRSHWKGLCGFLKGRTFTVFFCICEARDFETQIKILKERRAV
ncbi:hypothetical protein DFH06DRAFT_517065 [Mycena polygramma]|nr:hypothetical protein DFH06DRAFT_517065 [Mycena polygramma]